MPYSLMEKENLFGGKDTLIEKNGVILRIDD